MGISMVSSGCLVGVLKVSSGCLFFHWCQSSPSSISQCGKDNRILVWNPNSGPGEIVAELPTSNQWSFVEQPLDLEGSWYLSRLLLFLVLMEHLPNLLSTLIAL